MEIDRLLTPLPFDRIRRALLQPLVAAAALLLPYAALAVHWRVSAHQAQQRRALAQIHSRLERLDSCDLRHLKSGDPVVAISQIPLDDLPGQRTLKFVSQACIESSKLRETIFSVDSNTPIEMGAFMQLLEALQPSASKIPTMDLLVRSFKIQNEHSMSIQLSVVQRQAK